jgi:hypothetical protein
MGLDEKERKENGFTHVGRETLVLSGSSSEELVWVRVTSFPVLDERGC